ncbi:MAG TPA: hypothetical protein VLF66_20475 [Thermoanaerobaculia bacterium]|nr:hypothetical protein [Thermoanaerobaculia bacterium]
MCAKARPASSTARCRRTGDFRIVYRVIEDRVEVLVIAARHRRLQ